MIKRVIWIVVVCALVPLAGFVAGSGVLRATQWLTQEPPRRDGDFAALVAAVGSPVVLLSTSTCPWCERTRQWLRANRVAYRDCVVDRDPYAAGVLRTLRSDSVPQLVTAQSVVVGYDPDLFAALVPRDPATPMEPAAVATSDGLRCAAPEPAPTTH
ncbi:glutaredoxin family protein [Chiayiivirga flava]|uniref:Glutaredoxin n=1 Tax=Chiayiivirga flava TaxID=659595 RepID=A0A7W8D9V8_9GAMM|nr:glutaredoxin domain-containing protein [Chiayiivirga flava]MBB5208803.1 glutaredoxin [Chiayiivirga flava]